MGRSRTVNFTVGYRVDRGLFTEGEWRTRKQGQVPSMGKPSVENLAAHVAHLEASMKPGGCNAHLGERTILEAWITDEQTGVRVAFWVRPEPTRFEKVLEG